MPRANELKAGSAVEIDGVPHIVVRVQVQTPSARGGSSLYKVRYRNVRTKQKLDRTHKGDDLLADANLYRREVQFLFKQQDTYTFMDLSDYDQFVLTAEDVGEAADYLVEDMEDIRALMSDGAAIGIELPPAVELPIAECEPSIRGASATSRTKPATLSTGLVVPVPEYLSPGEVIRVDTRTGKFLSRA